MTEYRDNDLKNLHDQMVLAKLLPATLWHNYISLDISKAKFPAAITAQKIDAKVRLIKDLFNL